jgi:hypothetical protein
MRYELTDREWERHRLPPVRRTAGVLAGAVGR